jgi:DNA-binding MarR family transcriptional regulator
MKTEKKSAEASQALPVGHLLNLVAYRFRLETQTHLDQLKIPLRVYGVLNYVGSHLLCTQVQCARDVGMDISTLGRAVDHLEKLGFVERCAVDGDRRAHALRLTVQGEAFLTSASARVEQAEVKILEPLNPADQKRLRELLQSLVAHERSAE